ncbi:MAG: GNAT family N-acetyltransferase [Bacteroidota bacterium]
MLTYQAAISSDLHAIAQLHAQSWQQHYRGILSDHYLDHVVQEDRLKIWSERFDNPTDNQHIITAKENGQLIGFTCLFGGQDPTYGTYIDNLHVDKQHQGKRIGRRLLRLAGQWAHQHYPREGMHLLVFTANVAAIQFYEKVGGKRVGVQFYDLGDGTGRMGETAKYYWNIN